MHGASDGASVSQSSGSYRARAADVARFSSRAPHFVQCSCGLGMQLGTGQSFAYRVWFLVASE